MIGMIAKLGRLRIVTEEHDAHRELGTLGRQLPGHWPGPPNAACSKEVNVLAMVTDLGPFPFKVVD